MSDPKPRSIDDVGDYVPYAKKHGYESSSTASPSSSGALTLSDLWPEPDWKAMADDGRAIEVVAHLAMAYESIRRSPHPGGAFKLSQQQWDAAFVTGVEAAQALFDLVYSVEDVAGMHDGLVDFLGLDKASLTKDVLANVSYWALGRGAGRTIKPPFALTLRQRAMAVWLPKLDWPASNRAMVAGFVPAQLNDLTWRVVKIDGKHYRIEDRQPYSSEADALEAARRRIDKFYAERDADKARIPKRRQTADESMERVGPDWRNAENVSAETLMATYGFRAIQFGNAMSDKERQRWLNEAFDALADLADVTGFKRNWIGLGGMALAFGARGQGGAAAHFEPKLNVANLTRAQGAGSFAHEWAHALDSRLTKTLELDHIGYAFASSIVILLRSPRSDKPQHHRIFDAMRPMMLMMDPEYGRGSAYCDHADRIGQGHRAGSYWTLREELFARAFEAFIQDELEAGGRKSPWLVFGTREQDYDMSKVLGHPYPLGDERTQLNASFRALLAAVATR